MKPLIFFMALLGTAFSLNIENLTLDAVGNLHEFVSVDTAYGKVIGKRVQLPNKNPDEPEDLYVRKYLGIPYAEPPVGELRFKAPVEPKPWTEPLQAVEEPNSCFQQERYKGERSVSEDCLYLNVIVPDPVPVNASVMVYIYGGSFTMGTISYINFERLVTEKKVIIVAMNYRLGSFGFLYLDNEECPGNVGLRDQNLALKWVRSNIDRFGGDPDSVTLFGHSAGSISVGHHLLNPSSQHLFQRAILQSGSPFSMHGIDSKMKALHKSTQVVAVAGCTDTLGNLSLAVECLRKANASAILYASATLDVPHYPVIDNEYAFSSKELAVGKDKQVMLGVTSNDGGFVVNSIHKRHVVPSKYIFQTLAKTFLPHLKPQVLDLIRYFYKDHCNEHPEFKEEKASVRMVTDVVFTCSTNSLADALSRNGISTFMYQFMYRPLSSRRPVWIGADHTAELEFLFDSNHNPKEKLMSDQLINYWGNFAKYGNPNIMSVDNEKNELDGDPTEEILRVIVNSEDQNSTESAIESWPRYTFEEKGRLDIDLPYSRPAFGAIQEDQCSFWNHIFPLFAML